MVKNNKDTPTKGTKGLYLVTCCTSTRTEAPKVRCSDMGTGLTMSGALDRWLEMLADHDASVTPPQLYRGIGFHTVTKIADLIGSDSVRVLTGGQGLLKLDTKFVPYDFTSNKNHPGNILDVVTEEPFVIPLWWNMINKALRGTTTPVADLLDAKGTKLVVVALNKFFMKYLSDDMLASDNIDKLRIVVVGKSRSHVPTQLRQQVLQVEKAAVAGTVGNRNDVSHRAALLFIRKVAIGEIDIGASVEEHQSLLGDLSPSAVKNLVQLTPVDVLAKAPNLLEYPSIELAYQEARRRYGSIGGIIAFRSAWYHLKGDDTTPVERDISAAKSALEAIQSVLATRAAKHSGLDSDVIWELSRVFITTMRETLPDAKFNATDFQAWMYAYCEATDKKAPRGIDSLHKVGQFLTGSHIGLGLEKFKSDGGGVLYGLKSE